MHKPAEEPEPRHLLSAVALGFNGRYNRLITVGGAWWWCAGLFGGARPPTYTHTHTERHTLIHSHTHAHTHTHPDAQVTAQCRENQTGVFVPIFKDVLRSFEPPPAKRM